MKAIEQMKKEHEDELSKAKQSESKKPKGSEDSAKQSDVGETANKPDEGSASAEGAEVTASVEGTASAEQTPGVTQTLNLEFLKLDLSSLASTMEFINAFKAKGYPLHTLVCNAGVMVTKPGMMCQKLPTSFTQLFDTIIYLIFLNKIL